MIAGLSKISPFLLSIVLLCISFNAYEPSAPFKLSSCIDIDILETNYSTADYTKGEQIKNYFGNKYAWGHFSGVYLYWDKDSIVMNKHGYADNDNYDTLKINDLFQLASVSKMFTALVIVSLEEKGLLSTFDTLQKYFPNLPYKGITIDHLLSHQSGLPEYMKFANVYDKKKRKTRLTNDRVLEYLVKRKPRRYYKPGLKYKYCNTNYVLLAMIAEQVGGKHFYELLKEHVLRPALMDTTELLGYNRDWVREYPVKGAKRNMANYPEHYQNGAYGDKNIYSNLSNMFRFSMWLDNQPQTFKDYMYHPRSYNKSGEGWYAYGFRIRYYDDEKWIYHNGWWKGFKTYFWRCPDKDKGFIILTNTTRDKFIKGETLVSLFK